MRSISFASAWPERQSNVEPIAPVFPDSVWRADALGSHNMACLPSGFPQLDHELPGGGWPSGMLTELLWFQHGSGEIRLLTPVLSKLSQTGKVIILLAPPHPVFAPALTQTGIDIRQLLIIQPSRPADCLWAVEQILKSVHFGALLCWLPQARPEHLRRLQLAASHADGLSFVFRPAAARHESSPAPLRLLCQAAPSGQISIDIVKRRGPAGGKPILLQSKLLFSLNDFSVMPSAPAMLPATTDAMDFPLLAAVASGSGVSSLA